MNAYLTFCIAKIRTFLDRFKATQTIYILLKHGHWNCLLRKN
jgi:hypothetical protein